MIVPKQIIKRNNLQIENVVSSHCLWMAFVLLVVAAATSWAQIVRDERIRIRVDQPETSVFEAGSTMLVPARFQPSEAMSRPISCNVFCSPFEPRQSLAEISWSEKPSPAALDSQKLRLDIIGAAANFTDGNFGTVRISSVPRVEVQPGAGIHLEAVRGQAQPVFIQRVENNRIITRDPALPAPDELKKERLPQALPRLPQAAKEALTVDLQTGGFGRMQVIAQSVELIKSVPHRNLVLEGLQPGLTYKIRLVHERAAAADSVAENICRVPVCPADFVNPR